MRGSGGGRSSALLILVLAVGWLPSCAGTAPSSSPTPSPAPTPITSRALLHALDPSAGLLSTYEVSEMTGRLALLATVAVPGAQCLSADRDGRVVYTLDESRSALGFVFNTLRRYAVDGRSGALALRGEVARAKGPYSLARGEHHVFTASLSTIQSGHGAHYIGYFHAYEIRSDGQPVETTGPWRQEWPGTRLRAFANPASPIVYLLGTSSGWEPLSAYRATPEGDFIEQGPPLDLSEPEFTGLPVWLHPEAAAVVGEHFIIASGRSVASFGVDATTGWLRPKALVEMDSSFGNEPVLFAAGTPDGLVALGAADGLWLFAVDASGGIAATGNAVVPVLGDLAFHPSGRFLYLCSEGGLVTYQVERGSLMFFAYDPGVPAGRIVVTPSPP
jgi:6-phosphogluconolactonase (cycloisomerase 2 family)